MPGSRGRGPVGLGGICSPALPFQGHFRCGYSIFLHHFSSFFFFRYFSLRISIHLIVYIL